MITSKVSFNIYLSNRIQVVGDSTVFVKYSLKNWSAIDQSFAYSCLISVDNIHQRYDHSKLIYSIVPNNLNMRQQIEMYVSNGLECNIHLLWKHHFSSAAAANPHASLCARAMGSAHTKNELCSWMLIHRLRNQ